MASFSNNADDINCKYDKNKFYTENGLAINNKKDRKSHSRKAQYQTDERLKKIAETISQLPIKMQETLAEHVNALTVPGKQKNTHITKKFHVRNHNGQSATQKMLCEQYDEQLLDEETALEELEMDTKVIMHDEIKETYSTPITYHEYESGVSMWKRYGLTKDQFDAHREYEENLAKLEAYNQEPDNPDYRMQLEAAIKKYEDDFNAQVLKEDEDNQNDWWIEEYDEETYEEFLIRKYKVDDDRETYEEWLESSEEDRIQSLREAAIDDYIERLKY
jgi:hypothetical protein